LANHIILAIRVTGALERIKTVSTLANLPLPTFSVFTAGNTALPINTFHHLGAIGIKPTLRGNLIVCSADSTIAKLGLRTVCIRLTHNPTKSVDADLTLLTIHVIHTLWIGLLRFDTDKILAHLIGATVTVSTA
jgi:TPP-dependent trihydroxycyclohexane-1,2-dione (THcHDO) dehydratase